MSAVDYFVRQVSARSQENETEDGRVTLFKEVGSTRYSELCVAENSEERGAQGGAGGASRRRVGGCGQISLLFRRHLSFVRVSCCWRSGVVLLHWVRVPVVTLASVQSPSTAEHYHQLRRIIHGES
ncbi:hypothetical protein PHYPSEUDO_001861 [Phytophthora pseudosyringae]|uniref:Uncharacterized protein n=1 Tax=Phytophthora pseudosyringae TaxID=221518 RepID=A0A8T1V1Z8_9STRA|nr:hypothetical protein PHYPSEUDO_001861 [Phytophthora pseudosyringae]